MCYHAHYIFLACGHSISSVRRIQPSPPCPNQHRPQAAANKIPASQRPFSFDPSVIASPTSPPPEPFPAHAPWRLEGPFSSPESTPPIAEGDENERANESLNNETIPIVVTTTTEQQEKKHEANGTAAEGAREARQSRCGQILSHPYRSYKLEGSCLPCRRRRDTLLARFEVNAMREAVYRESVLAPTKDVDGVVGAQRRRWALAAYAKEEDGIEDVRGLKALPLPLSTPRPSLGDGVHFQTGEGVEQQQQQTPWRLTLPPAEIPRTGWGLAGMRDGEWI